MKKTVLLLLGLFFTLGLHAQNYRVVDEQGEGVAFVTVHDYENNDGIVANNNGYFKYTPDTKVILSSVGFTSDTVFLSKNKEVISFELSVDVRVLNMIEVSSAKVKYTDFVRVGYDQDPHSYYNHLIGHASNSGVKIMNPRNEIAKVEKLFFGIKFDRDVHLRIRVLALDDKGEPIYDLLKENIIINKGNLLGDLVIDLSKYKVFMPETGMMIAYDVIGYLSKKKDAKFKISVSESRRSNMTYYLKGGDSMYNEPRDLKVFNNGPEYYGNFRYGAKISYPDK